MLSDVISRFSTAAADGTPNGYPVRRRAIASFGSDGQIISGGVSNLTIDASVQPFRARGDIILPEGVHVADVRVIDTLTPIQTNPPDSITIAGEAFSVFQVDGPTNFPNSQPRYTAYAARQATP